MHLCRRPTLCTARLMANVIDRPQCDAQPTAISCRVRLKYDFFFCHMPFAFCPSETLLIFFSGFCLKMQLLIFRMIAGATSPLHPLSLPAEAYAYWTHTHLHTAIAPATRITPRLLPQYGTPVIDRMPDKTALNTRQNVSICE